MTICMLRARFCFVISSSKICHSDLHLPSIFISYLISYPLTQNISYPIVLQNSRADPFTTWPCKYMSTPPASIPPLAPTTEGRLLATPPDAHHWHHASQMPPKCLPSHPTPATGRLMTWHWKSYITSITQINPPPATLPSASPSHIPSLSKPPLPSHLKPPKHRTAHDLANLAIIGPRKSQIN